MRLLLVLTAVLATAGATLTAADAFAHADPTAAVTSPPRRAAPTAIPPSPAAGEGERERAGGWGSAGEGERERAGGWGSVAPVAGHVRRVFEQPDGPYGRGHRGVDLVARSSERVRAAMPGTVRFAGPVAGERWITVTHADGLETTYGGVTPTVEAGQRVMLGQPIGRIRAGRRYLDWGARLHGAYIDPLGLLTGWRVRLVAPSGGP